MRTAAQQDLTQRLAELDPADPRAASELLPLLYDELRALARRRLRHEPAGQTLQATALVHEAYLRLLGDEDVCWDNRGHFFGAAAEAMRRILVERARRYARKKHGGAYRRIGLTDTPEQTEGTPDAADVLALDAALRKLEAEDPARSAVVKLRYFAGLTIAQTAAALGLSVATVKRHWVFVQAWLAHEMTDGGDERGCQPSSPDSGD